MDLQDCPFQEEPLFFDRQRESAFAGPPPSATKRAEDFLLDINNYIPVGCIRISKRDVPMSSAVWMSCQSWNALQHPRDAFSSHRGPVLNATLQDILLTSKLLHKYFSLWQAGWIRMEFKVQQLDCGQVRVYVLPNDVGRGYLRRDDRPLRNAMVQLISELDVSPITWNGGHRDTYTPCFHVNPTMDENPMESASLFEIFNSLPSPTPDPAIIATDEYSQEAMQNISDNTVHGLKTKMYSYQRRSAALMLQREVHPGHVVDPRLLCLTDHHGAEYWCDVENGLCLRQPRAFEGAKGGILAETMGLGKTLICLALICATKDLNSKIPVEHSLDSIPIRRKTASLKEMAAATIGRSGQPWKGALFQYEEKGGVKYDKCREALKAGQGFYYIAPPQQRRESCIPVHTPQYRKVYLSGATIVVCPANLVQQWRHEIKRHTEDRYLEVLVVDNLRDELPDALSLSAYDIILFSKQRFDREAKGLDESDDRQTAREINTSWWRRPKCDSTSYQSPLRQVHFKRLVVDEGHSFGNSSNSFKSESVVVIDNLQLSARWIVSGTPTPGLFGVERTIEDRERSSLVSTPLLSVPSAMDSDRNLETKEIESFSKVSAYVSRSATSLAATRHQEKMTDASERKNLEKLGNIATMFLKARPWANVSGSADSASWKQFVMQPRHGARSRGNPDCLKVTLEGMFIRHRLEDVELDVKLPKLERNIVYLNGSVQNKLLLNTFAMMIIVNAVTSERKDADYFFHPKQRKNLLQLVSNLRQASFFWSSFEADHVQSTIDTAKKFLEEKKIPITEADDALLQQVINMGEKFLANEISQAIITRHEMPMYMQNRFSDDIRNAWSLTGDKSTPTLLGATMMHQMQKFINSQLWKDDPMEFMFAAGVKAMNLAEPGFQGQASITKKPESVKKAKKRLSAPLPELAGGVTVGDEPSPRKRPRSTVSANISRKVAFDFSISETLSSPNSTSGSLQGSTASQFISVQDTSKGAHFVSELFSIKATVPEAAHKSKTHVSGTIDPNSTLAGASLISTASAKLSYLIDKISLHAPLEKIIVFYEADNVAYYIAQALEVLGIHHLIYAKTLDSARRSQYVVTFNQVEHFRVLLMDVGQAAYGLDMSSASRVYFVNPVFNPQIEEQAMKRAHRIGQTKPVFVETLVLRGSIEEVIVKRREEMSSEEVKKCKNILDDEAMLDWVRNVKFLPILEGVSGPEQMAKMEVPKLLFVDQTMIKEDNPDTGLVPSSPIAHKKGKGKKRVKFASASVSQFCGANGLATER